MATAVRVRMYRTGFGDCFLLSFGSARHVLIDFGAHMHGEIGTMEPIMDNIEKETGLKLELLVATHAHRDHISGFGKFADRFAQFQIGEVWMPWTDKESDPHANALERKHLALYERLENHLRLALGATEADPRYAAALHALSNLRGNERARSELRRAFGTGARVSYLGAGDAFAKVGGATGLSAEILGPPADKDFFSRMDPPADQRYLAGPGDPTGVVRPFPDLEIKVGESDYDDIVKEGQPQVPAQELNDLKELAEAPAGRLALALDSVRNNTSLVILFRFRGKSLLFPGDAQWGNWQSWIGTDGARRLLGELDFLKVAHHGSHNATPAGVVEALRKSGLAVMIPTQVEPYPTIPRVPLIEALEKHCIQHMAVRSDWTDVASSPVPARPRPPRLPRGFKHGRLWIDYSM